MRNYSDISDTLKDKYNPISDISDALKNGKEIVDIQVENALLKLAFYITEVMGLEKDEFIKKAKEIGYTDEMIADDIRLHEEAKKEGIKIPWELRLVELPIA